jgi:hypothetical protein
MNQPMFSFFIEEAQRYYYIPVGAMLIGARWIGGRLRVDFLGTRAHPSEMRLLKDMQNLAPGEHRGYIRHAFVVCKINDTLSGEHCWSVPIRLDDDHYLFYTALPT